MPESVMYRRRDGSWRLPSGIRALTVCQPWASLIAETGKDMENRTWITRWRGTLLIHAGLGRDSVPVPDERLAWLA